MTIQRQYTLPHCNLVLEGLSANANDPLSPMAVLMNADCYLPGAIEAPLTGGREFLDSLVAAVSRYGQQLLSGVPRPPAGGSPPPLIDVKAGEGSFHHLIVQQQPLGEPVTDANALPPQDIKLSTVQFYDLMEAVDQLLADRQTLPDLTAQFQAVPRRLVKPAEPMTKRATPAVIGAAALAAAGLALFFVPPPAFEPTRPTPESDTPTQVDPEADAVTTPPTPTPENQSGNPSEIQPGNESQASLEAGDIDRLTTAPAITNQATVALLQTDLTRRLQEAWAANPLPNEDLAYRVVVSEDGDILGYKYQTDQALAAVDTTPLPQLTFTPVEGANPVQESVAQFVATFTPTGDVVVEPVASPTAEGSGPSDLGSADAGLPTLTDKITDGDQIRSLNSTLYDKILSELEPLSASESLTYQVRLGESGNIIGFEPQNAAAGLLVNETPLPNLAQPGGATNGKQADFMVVFTEAGVLEVSPWDGWPQ